MPWGIYLPLDRLGVHPLVCGAGGVHRAVRGLRLGVGGPVRVHVCLGVRFAVRVGRCGCGGALGFLATGDPYRVKVSPGRPGSAIGPVT